MSFFPSLVQIVRYLLKALSSAERLCIYKFLFLSVSDPDLVLPVNHPLSGIYQSWCFTDFIALIYHRHKSERFDYCSV